MQRRSIFLAATVAACTLGGVALGATGSAAPAAAPPDTSVTFEDLTANLTPEQVDCLVGGIGAVPEDDVDAFVDLLFSCGVTAEDLDRIFGDSSAGGEMIAETMLSEGPFANIGVSEEASACLAERLALGPPADQPAALFLLRVCGVSLVDIVTNVGTNGGGTEVTAPPTVAAPGPTTAAPVEGPLTVWEPTGDPFVDGFAEEVVAAGTNLNRDEILCIAETAKSRLSELGDDAVLLEILATCGVSPGDL